MTKDKSASQNQPSIWNAVLLSVGVPLSAIAFVLSLVSYLSVHPLDGAPQSPAPTLSTQAKAEMNKEIQTVVDAAVSEALLAVQDDLTQQTKKIQALITLQLSEKLPQISRNDTSAASPTAELDPTDTVALGQALARRQCASCHTFNDGQPHRIGPNLFAIVDRPAAQHPGFRYSNALKKSDIIWTPQALFNFLDNPKTFVAGTKMTYPGLPNLQSRQYIVDYLISLEPKQ